MHMVEPSKITQPGYFIYRHHELFSTGLFFLWGPSPIGVNLIINFIVLLSFGS